MNLFLSLSLLLVSVSNCAALPISLPKATTTAVNPKAIDSPIKNASDVIFPLLDSALKTAIHEGLHVIDQEVEQDIVHLVSKPLNAKWIPHKIKNRIIDFIRHDVMDKVFARLETMVDSSIDPKIDQIISILQSKVGGLDNLVDGELEALKREIQKIHRL